MDPRAIATLLKAIDDPDLNVVRAATNVLGFAGDPASAGLIRMLGSADHAVRMHAIAGLGRLRSRDAVPALISCLEGRRYSEREWAAGALVNIRDERALEPLREASQRERLPWRRRRMSRHPTHLASATGR